MVVELNFPPITLNFSWLILTASVANLGAQFVIKIIARAATELEVLSGVAMMISAFDLASSIFIFVLIMVIVRKTNKKPYGSAYRK